MTTSLSEAKVFVEMGSYLMGIDSAELLSDPPSIRAPINGVAGRYDTRPIHLSLRFSIFARNEVPLICFHFSL